jgi:hypothetical protein
MSLNLYWGDLHSHCSISYGHGTVEQSLARAQQQLDFCSVTGHAFWPDMPTDREQYGEIIDYHHQGFATLARNWQSLLEKQDLATTEGAFIAFPSYEWHSLQHGDHNVYARTSALPLVDAQSVAELRSAISKQNQIAIPHHIGYRSGYRGINWDTYSENQSPFVEIFSLHGCSLSDDAPYPMLHDMGPRDFGSTAEAGWERGFQFGIVGGTDHHAAYPGSHGDGRMAVLAKDLTREAIWEAFQARRVYAATGDKIDARLEVNDAPIGSCITATGQRAIKIRVRGVDALNVIELKKNGRPLQTWTGRTDRPNPSNCYQLRLTWGWGQKKVTTPWKISLELKDGTIQQIETHFSGQAIVSPQSEAEPFNLDEPNLPHEILEKSDQSLTLRSITQGNLSMRHETTQSISLQLVASPDARLHFEVNGNRFSHRLDELIHRARSHFMRGWLSEAIRVGPLIPEPECCFETTILDQPTQAVDRYQLNVSQRNGQWAWLSPIWVQQ